MTAQGEGALLNPSGQGASPILVSIQVSIQVSTSAAQPRPIGPRLHPAPTLRPAQRCRIAVRQEARPKGRRPEAEPRGSYPVPMSAGSNG